MKANWGRVRTEVVVADITTLTVDAIVNAANNTLLGGGGVDGAIHRAAGPALREACIALAGCTTGQAKITPGFALPARRVIHTVGPVWQGGQRGESELLAGCYRHSLDLALQAGCASVVFPAISTGVYRFPKALAAQVTKEAVRNWAARHFDADLLISFCFSSESDADIFRAAALPGEQGLRVFLDDERPTPEGWVRASWPDEVIALLNSGQVVELSLDHDLGNDERGTGYDVILWLEEAVFVRGFCPPKVSVHSANAAARLRMQAGIEAIERQAFAKRNAPNDRK